MEIYEKLPGELKLMVNWWKLKMKIQDELKFPIVFYSNNRFYASTGPGTRLFHVWRGDETTHRFGGYVIHDLIDVFHPQDEMRHSHYSDLFNDYSKVGRHWISCGNLKEFIFDHDYQRFQ